jgi:hypothetical protein
MAVATFGIIGRGFGGVMTRGRGGGIVAVARITLGSKVCVGVLGGMTVFPD